MSKSRIYDDGTIEQGIGMSEERLPRRPMGDPPIRCSVCQQASCGSGWVYSIDRGHVCGDCMSKEGPDAP